MMVELKPAPKEAIDLLERMNRLEEEILFFKSEIIEDHRLIHEAQRKKNQAIDNRLGAIEDLIIVDNKIGQTHKDQGDVLKLLLNANQGKMLLSDARKKMQLSPSQFSQLLKTMKKEVESKPLRTDRKRRVLNIIKMEALV